MWNSPPQRACAYCSSDWSPQSSTPSHNDDVDTQRRLKQVNWSAAQGNSKKERFCSQVRVQHFVKLRQLLRGDVEQQQMSTALASSCPFDLRKAINYSAEALCWDYCYYNCTRQTRGMPL